MMNQNERVEKLKKIFDMPEEERIKALDKFYGVEPVKEEKWPSWEEFCERRKKLKYDPHFAW